jgi:hypothetical protein
VKKLAEFDFRFLQGTQSVIYFATWELIWATSPDMVIFGGLQETATRYPVPTILRRNIVQADNRQFDAVRPEFGVRHKHYGDGSGIFLKTILLFVSASVR